MADFGQADDRQLDNDGARRAGRPRQTCRRRFEASFEAAARAQDAPRASRSSNRLLTKTMLANPNGLNNCASFLAKPL